MGASPLIRGPGVTLGFVAKTPRRRSRRVSGAPAKPRESAAARLAEAERLYRDFAQLTPYPPPKPFARSFVSWAEYERWRDAQTNPWLR
jgi:hypothetical protein